MTGLCSSPALEAGKSALRLGEIRFVKSSAGKGLGRDVQFWNVTSSLRGSLCVMGRSQVTQTGAGGCREHWAQLVMALHSSVPSAACWWAAESTWESWEGTEIRECLFCKRAHVPRQKAGAGWELLPLPTATFSIGSSEMQTSKHVFPSALAGITSSMRRVKEKGWRELKP